jgi:hypothetical protein
LSSVSAASPPFAAGGSGEWRVSQPASDEGETPPLPVAWTSLRASGWEGARRAALTLLYASDDAFARELESLSLRSIRG